MSRDGVFTMRQLQQNHPQIQLEAGVPTTADAESGLLGNAAPTLGISAAASG
ncbi:hypothetical protein [endosymbiont of Lamellibrachia barhami]|uniref:hypothetical protein n=1 Tax=endosymbiont of Lamellibrachia barhami TaxID=205975 RepID=UPI0015AE5679|nr:hypothetical protein [endosymbiont of Lamellibrachia barhami]